MVENRNGIFTINETELLQEIETTAETGARSLQVMITIMTLVPFSASGLVIVLHSAITRQPELNERKYLRTSMLLMAAGFVILIGALFILVWISVST